MALRKSPRTGDGPMAMATRRPGLAFTAIIASLLGGFASAAVFDNQAARWVRAETDPSEQEQTISLKDVGLRVGSDVWPILEQSFPQQIDIFSPEPLATPVRTLGPTRVDTSVLASAMKASLKSRPSSNGTAATMEAANQEGAGTTPTQDLEQLQLFD